MIASYLIQSDILSAIFIEPVFITMWSLELFKHLTLTGGFCFLLICHRGVKFFEHVSRLLHSWSLVSGARLTSSKMAFQGQGPAFSACLVQERSHSRLKLFMSSNGYKSIYTRYFDGSNGNSLSSPIDKRLFSLVERHSPPLPPPRPPPPPPWGTALRLITSHSECIIVS